MNPRPIEGALAGCVAPVSARKPSCVDALSGLSHFPANWAVTGNCSHSCLEIGFGIAACGLQFGMAGPRAGSFDAVLGAEFVRSGRVTPSDPLSFQRWTPAGRRRSASLDQLVESRADERSPLLIHMRRFGPNTKGRSFRERGRRSVFHKRPLRLGDHTHRGRVDQPAFIARRGSMSINSGDTKEIRAPNHITQ